MPSILLFGATGSVGRFLLPQLLPRQRVLAVSRSPPAGEPGWIKGDLNDRGTAWPAAQTLISLGPLDTFATWLQHYPASTPQRVIALSSMSAESKRDSIDPHERALAERLRAAETRVQEAAARRGIQYTLFRPTLIYGAGNDRSLAPIARFAQRWRVLPVPFGASGLRQPVHARDLAGACLAVLGNPATFGKTYHLGGGERLRFDALLMRLRAAIRGPVLPLPVPMAALRLAARWRQNPGFNAAAIARLRVPLVADNTGAANDFAYAPVAFVARDALPQQFRSELY
jgi:nucleoside-diphosphate-sugar epimerase